MLVVSGIVMTVIGFTFASPLATLLGANAETINETTAYIRGMALGILPLLLIPCLMTFLQMCNKSGVSLTATILLAIFNASFCLANIFIFNGGVFGVSLATSLSRWATAAFIVIYIVLKKDLVNFDASSFDLNMCKETIILGSPASLAGILYSARNVFINKYAMQVGGNTAVNALAILGSCGERDSTSLKELMRITIFVGWMLCLLKFIVVYPFGRQIAMLFGGEGNVIEETNRLLIYYTWSAPFNMVTLTFMGANQSLGRVAYCNALSAKDGLSPAYAIDGESVVWDRSASGYRLPTEAEWEYACRAGTTGPFNLGHSPSADEANYYGHYPYEIEGNYFDQDVLEVKPGVYRGEPIASGSFEPNAWGLYDMHGNVAEWVWDRYDAYDTAASQDPVGPDAGTLRVNRGGGWNDFAKNLRSAYRASLTPTSSSPSVGFRVAETLPRSRGLSGALRQHKQPAASPLWSTSPGVATRARSPMRSRRSLAWRRWRSYASSRTPPTTTPAWTRHNATKTSKRGQSSPRTLTIWTVTARCTLATPTGGRQSPCPLRRSSSPTTFRARRSDRFAATGAAGLARA